MSVCASAMSLCTVTDLFNSHDYLYCVKTVEAKIVVEVRFGVELVIGMSRCPLYIRTSLFIPSKCPGPVG